MTTSPEISTLIQQFISGYDASAKDEIWQGLSQRFKTFWYQHVLAEGSSPISDADCDEVLVR